jgi:predicted permease
MDGFHLLSPVVPVFLLVGTGFAFAHWKKISLVLVTEIIVYLGTPALGGALLRMIGGFAAAVAGVKLIGVEGINRQVLILYGSLPAAVINFLLTEKYRQDPELAASIVVLSTMISVITIPPVFWLIL